MFTVGVRGNKAVLYWGKEVTSQKHKAAGSRTTQKTYKQVATKKAGVAILTSNNRL